MADAEEVEEVEEQVEAIPELWGYVNPPSGSGPLVGKIVKFLNDKEDEEILEEVQRKNPATGQSLLMWATLQQKFVLVEWLVKKLKRSAFAFSDQDKEMTVFDKFAEKRAERRQEEKDRLAELEENPEAAEEDEDKEPPPPIFELVKTDLGGEEGIDEHKIRQIGELGVYQGQRHVETRTKTGLGQTLFVNGDAYIGEYTDNKRNGVGSYYWAETGELYIGEWRNNQRAGTGRMIYADGSRYYGTWRFNEQEGEGRFTYLNGDTYSGCWSKSMKQGHGTYTVAQESSQFVGTFDQDEFITGEWKLSGGMRYSGVFKDFKPIGKGIFLHKNGQDGSYVQDGFYEDGVWHPSQIRTTQDSIVSLDIMVQGKVLQLVRSKQLNIDLAKLVQVANFPPFEDWLNKMSDPKRTTPEFHIQGLEVREINADSSTGLLESVKLAIHAVDESGVRWPRVGQLDPDCIVFSNKSRVVVPVIRHGADQKLIYITKPLLVAGEIEAPVLIPVTLLKNGSLSSKHITSLERIGIQISSDAVIDLTPPDGAAPGGMFTNAADGNALQQVLYWTQEVTAEYWNNIEDRVASINEAGSLEKLRLTSLKEFQAATPDASSLAAIHLLESLRDKSRVPESTVEKMRPPTPPPPIPETRPVVAPPPPAEEVAPVPEPEEE
eukprot:TRINITY_DN3249_c0_g1_i1.p1 TRINITY_DN3249_c0_g1~~TRINITY_DN3249_c0_g1_i1.p1  ORF type:complete len:676 (+),score=180.34 TRINITY_DN3249_c0_g1_i1:43-2028(+)